MPVIAVHLLPREARSQWAECWKADLRELARRDDMCGWLMQSYGVAIAAAKIRLDRRHPDSCWARVSHPRSHLPSPTADSARSLLSSATRLLRLRAVYGYRTLCTYGERIGPAGPRRPLDALPAVAPERPGGAVDGQRKGGGGGSAAACGV
jgi:hypothetical protein